MACEDILGELVRQFENNTARRNADLNNRDGALSDRDRFLTRFPFRVDADTIQRIRTLDGVYDFLTWLVWTLRPLGGIRAVRPGPAASAAYQQLDRFQDLVHTVVSDLPVAAKIDAWDIPYFRGDRHIAKKMVATYFPEKSLPIFATRRLEYHAKLLNIDIDRESLGKYGLHYADVTLTVGQKWQLLTEAVLARKTHNEALGKEDNVYFMYILERNLPQGF